MQPPEFVSIFVSRLEAAKLEYFVTGSIAAIFYGEPRLTHDIDLVVHLPDEAIEKFITIFHNEDEFYCPPSEVINIESRRRPFGHFNVIYHESGLKADIYPDGDDALHAWAMKERRRIELSLQQSLWVAPPEYLIIRKLEYFREGGSTKHLDDIRKMLPQVQAELSMTFLDVQLSARGLMDQWKRLVKVPNV